MTDVATLSPAWLSAAPVRELVDVCEVHMLPIRFVGGCVRDAIMGRESGDLDVATSALPQQVMEVFAATQHRVVPTGLQHGTVMVVIEGQPFEITTLRVDAACDGRHAEVIYTDDWEQDALRRDFTMNALMLAPDGTLYDYVGGREDALAGRVQFIGDPEARIQEDYLRILRLFRFLATHGRQSPDVEALAACRQHRDGLARLSVERIAQEMMKLLAAPSPLEALRQMEACGITEVLYLSSSLNLTLLESLLSCEVSVSSVADPVIRLLCLYGDASLELAQQWKLPKWTQMQLSAALAMPVLDSTEVVQHALYTYQRDAVLTALWWQSARAGHMDAAMLDVAAQFQPPVFPIGGKDLEALGMHPGKAMGACLKRLEQDWLASGFTLTREQLLSQVGDDIKR